MNVLDQLRRLHAIAHVTAACEEAAKVVPPHRHDEMTIALARLLACIMDANADKAVEAANQANAAARARTAAERGGMS